MSHRIATLFVLVGSVIASVANAQFAPAIAVDAAPPLAVEAAPPFAAVGVQADPVFVSDFPYMAGFSKELLEKQSEIDELQEKLESDDLGAAEKKETVEKLEEAVASLLDLEVKQLKDQLVKMQETIDTRVADRDKLIRSRVEKIVNAPKPGEITFRVGKVQKQDDGSSIAQVTLMRSERRTRLASFTQMKEKKVTRTVNGQEQEYTVNVPVMASRAQKYNVQVPVGQESIPIPKGKDVNETVQEFIDSETGF